MTLTEQTFSILRGGWILFRPIAVISSSVATIVSSLLPIMLYSFVSTRYLAFLLLIGVWSAVSYSLPPFNFSYQSFLGEWLSLFPAILFLGLAGPWVILEPTPLWAMQNAVINALFCLAWVMVHHIPDLEADKQAIPTKRTSVVWFVDTFGIYYARFPVLIYLFAAGLCAFWLGMDRLWASSGLIITVLVALFLIIKVDVEDHEQVTHYEKILLMLAMATAVGLGVFV